MNTNKIIIGTAQFGMDYGIANKFGQVPIDEVKNILDLAISANVTHLDTAALYGNSEEVLGNFSASHWDIISKLKPIPNNCHDIPQFVNAELTHSLIKLKKKSIKGFLVHHGQDLLNSHGDDLFSELMNLKKQNKIERIGVSVYSPEEAIAILEKYQLDLLQFPLNIFDQRFLPYLKTFKAKSLELHSRSTFLQGLLLMDPMTIHSYFKTVKIKLNLLRQHAFKINISVRNLLINFVASIREIDHVIFGIDNTTQLQEIISDFGKRSDIGNTSLFSCDDVNIIDPSRWKLT